ncbi:MAG TPA: hypothetical protein VNW92_01945 [Polyangiaceae bacterium]|jgi:hypothetical protein|nr:hypothetical protein [Polyangiaceae bacterium]
MDTKLLIDSIVRQTTVLIAQLSTAAGIRAPLSHVADQVFLNLSQELESQGVSRKVVADMFGLVLRGYQKKVQRLTESQTEGGKTLWLAVHEHLQREGSTTRKLLFRAFVRDDPNAVGAVLNDLVSSGLAYKTGTGDNSVYGVTQPQDHALLTSEHSLETASLLLWLMVYENAGSTRESLAAATKFDEARVDAALQLLIDQGRVCEHDGQFTADTLSIPVGAEQGWEAAVFDHFQSVCTAIARKLRQGAKQSRSDDRVGGATLAFDVHDGHPYKDEVYESLARVRAQMNELWQRVVDYDRDNPVPDGQKQRVTFYFGQTVTLEEDEP